MPNSYIRREGAPHPLTGALYCRPDSTDLRVGTTPTRAPQAPHLGVFFFTLRREETVSGSLEEMLRKRVKSLEERNEALRADLHRMRNRVAEAKEAREEAEQRAQEAYEAGTEAMKILDELLHNEEGWTGDHALRFVGELWPRFNELADADSWVEETEGVEVR